MLRVARQIHRCVEVSVNDQAAVVAFINPLGQVQLGFHRTTAGARFGTRKPAVSAYDSRPIPIDLAGELAKQLAEASVTESTIKGPFA